MGKGEEHLQSSAGTGWTNRTLIEEGKDYVAGSTAPRTYCHIHTGFGMFGSPLNGLRALKLRVEPLNWMRWPPGPKNHTSFRRFHNATSCSGHAWGNHRFGGKLLVNAMYRDTRYVKSFFGCGKTGNKGGANEGGSGGNICGRRNGGSAGARCTQDPCVVDNMPEKRTFHVGCMESRHYNAAHTCMQ